MKIKTFHVESIDNLDQFIQDELGPNAMILSKKQLPGENLFEVTVGIPESKKEKTFPTHSLTQTLNELQSRFSKEQSSYEHPSVNVQSIQEMIRDELKHVQENAFVNSPKRTSIEYFLCSNGLLPQFANRISAEFYNQFGQSSLSDESKQRKKEIQFLIKRLQIQILVNGPWIQPGKAPHIAVLIGPSGSGKTLTARKIAYEAEYKLGIRAAVIHLQSSEETPIIPQMELNERTLTDPLQLQDQIADLSDSQLIILDAPSINPFQSTRFEHLHEWLSSLDDATYHLTIPSTMDCGDALAMLREFSSFDLQSFVLTKFDETIRPGLMINLIQSSKLPVSYLTESQNIQDGLSVADPNELARKVIIRGSNDSYSRVKHLLFQGQ